MEKLNHVMVWRESAGAPEMDDLVHLANGPEDSPEALEDPTDDQLRLDAPIMTKRHRYAWDEFDGGCQIEIDVDAIPAETFWKLDTYVKEKVQDRGRGPWSDDLT